MRKLLLVIFFTLFGLGIGLVIGALVMRRLDRAAARVSPRAVRTRATRSATDWRTRLRVAMDAGARAAAAKEEELRARYGVPPVADVAASTGE